MAPKLAGFFYDEDTNKYFPLHMKKEYDDKKKAEEAQAFKNAEVAANTCVSEVDLNRYMRLAMVPKFSNLERRIDRLEIKEIICKESIASIVLSPETKSYQVALRRGEEVIFQTIYDGVVLEEYRLDDHLYFDRILSFRLYKYFNSSNEPKYVVYGSTELENGTRFFALGDEYDFSTLISDDDIDYKTYFMSDDWVYFFSYINDKKVIRRVSFIKRAFEIIEDEDTKNLDFGRHFTGLGAVFAFRGGLIKNFHCPVEIKFKLPESSAKWIHYHDGAVYIITYHGNLLKVKLDSPKEFKTLANIKDLYDYDNDFERIFYEASDNILGFHYEWSNKIILLNLEDGRFLKVVHLENIFYKFKICWSNLSVYAHVYSIG